MTSIRTYSELVRLGSFDERYDYLKLGGSVGERTFGGNRYLNQRLYTSREWRRFRDQIILRDDGCDLGVPGYSLKGRIYVHHINPITENDLKHGSDSIFDPVNVIIASFATHEAIHYANDDLLIPQYTLERKPFDTCPWKGERCQIR